ncbi:MAG TPA: enoyl-CoA hydratase-related protein [Pseudonocardia sp.]|jgi:enoyl-CoA hydratase/carnithine racemase|nr:enoyl-CoA hydratase-related protein [Pseudonocardia sp.]
MTGDGQVSCAVDKAGIATITISRGERNQMAPRFVEDLRETLLAADADPEVRAVVLTGAGRSFSVGADLSSGVTALEELFEADGGYREPDYREPAARMVLAMASVGVPIVAAINGDAVGGGATITLAADARFAVPTARFGFPFTRLGLCPEGASTYYLPRLVGHARATDWLLSGRLVPATEALEAGMVSELVAPEQLVEHAREFARGLVAHSSPTAVAVTRALLNANPQTPDQAAQGESSAIVELARAADCREGTEAFRQRREPRFRPREPRV